MKKYISLFLLIHVSIAAFTQTVQQADSLHQQGRELVNEGKIAEGRECTRQAMEIRKKLLGEVSEDYITSLNNYAYSYGAQRNWQKAVDLQEQVMILCGKLKQPHKNIGLYTTNMGRYYYMRGDKTKAVQMWEQALPLVEKYGEIYEFLLNSLGSVYSDAGDQQGISRIMALMEDHNQHELTKPCDEPKCMLERAQYYGTTGNQAKAKECYLEALKMAKDNEMKAQANEAYASFLSGVARDFASAADYYQVAAQTRKVLDGGETEAYAILTYKVGMNAFIGKSYEQSIAAYQKVLEWFNRNNHAEKHKYVPLCIKGIGHAYSGLKDYGKARDSYQTLVTYYEQNDPANEEYPKAILRLAKAEKFNQEYTPSIEHHKQAMAIFEERGMANDYAEAATSLQLCYQSAGINEIVDSKHDASHAARMAKIDELIKNELDGLELTKAYLGKLQYARSLATLGGCYAMKEDYENSVDYYEQYIKVVREAIRDEFQLQSEGERMILWEDEKKDISNMLELLTDIPEENKALLNRMSAISYDSELLSKGILLNSSIEFEKVLAESGNQQLQDIYRQTKDNEKEIEHLRKSATTDQDLERILKLMQDNQDLQLRLSRGCSEFKDFTNYISYTWQDVKQKLNPEDIAIEFAMVGSYVALSTNELVALVLTKDMATPEVVFICPAKELNELEKDSSMFSKNEYETIIWARLKDYLKGKRRIFFSADGALNRLGIEYLLYNHKPLSDQFEVYRLSSTKEICYKRHHTELSKAALFGDVNYNDGATNSASAQRSLSALRGSGGIENFADLSNTLREVSDIQRILKSSGVKVAELFRDTEASKPVFMNLTDTKVNLLHIATHGMYKDLKTSNDTESMQNSLLAFAGANLDDSGFVTAADIAQMNLRQCDLAVLSACETGLGKLGGDGVFGLQRGFKNAGVHTLLMSLKNVYDDSTADLMISFYQHLVSGASKREALVRAQQDIRNKGFNDPKYWATFILLDAF